MWWKQAIFYQVYLRSYCDSNGDGIGDLQGLISKLDYIKNLGIDAIWITPFLKSPFKDFGYDIQDYRCVDPVFGTEKDFDAVLNEAHKRNLKIVIDMVYSHTSDQCIYFQESRKSKNNSYSDWYVWADPKIDGSPPNNWKSIFGGSAWSFNHGRQQYYLHNFLKEQPDLNMHNISVQNEILNISRYWLNKGVDGFRLDVCNFYFHDPSLRDNPPRPPDQKPTGGSILQSPYQLQMHIYDKDHPENLEFLKKLRSLDSEYPNIFLMAEIASDNQLNTIKSYTAPDKLHSAYSFELLVDEFSTKEIIRASFELKEVHPTWSFSNHDVKRVATRWAHGNIDKTKCLFVLLLSLKGTPIIYQGEECGYTESDLAFEDLVDPYGLAFYPKFKGRDGCRTPMAWDEEMPKMWLPVDPLHKKNSVNKQDQEPDSFLNFSRKWIEFRNKHKTLLALGDIQFDFIDNTFVVKRSHLSKSISFVFDTDFKKFDVQIS